MQLPCKQNDFAARDPERADAKIDHDRQNRFTAQVHFEKRTSVFCVPQARERKSWLRICREKTQARKNERATSGLNCRAKRIDATMRSVVVSDVTLCVAPSAGLVMTKSSIRANLGIVRVSAAAANASAAA